MALRALGSFPPRGSAELKQVWLCSRLQRRLVRCLLTKLPSRADKATFKRARYKFTCNLTASVVVSPKATISARQEVDI